MPGYGHVVLRLDKDPVKIQRERERERETITGSFRKILTEMCIYIGHNTSIRYLIHSSISLLLFQSVYNQPRC